MALRSRPLRRAIARLVLVPLRGIHHSGSVYRKWNRLLLPGRKAHQGFLMGADKQEGESLLPPFCFSVSLQNPLLSVSNKETVAQREIVCGVLPQSASPSQVLKGRSGAEKPYLMPNIIVIKKNAYLHKRNIFIHIQLTNFLELCYYKFCEHALLYTVGGCVN